MAHGNTGGRNKSCLIASEMSSLEDGTTGVAILVDSDPTVIGLCRVTDEQCAYERYLTTYFNAAGIRSRCRSGVRDISVTGARADGSNLDGVRGWEEVSKRDPEIGITVPHQELHSTRHRGPAIGGSCERGPIFRINLEEVRSLSITDLACRTKPVRDCQDD